MTCSVPFRRALRAALVGACLAALPGVSAAAEPSFQCKRAKAWVEKAVCGSDALVKRDLDLAVVHARLLRAVNGTARAALDREQQQWWAALGSCRKAADPNECLAGRYDDRIASIRDRPDYPGDTRARRVVPLPPTLITRGGEGWTRGLSGYVKALRACTEESPTRIGKLLVAWVTDDPESVAMRLKDWELGEWVCIAHRDGHKVFRFESATGAPPMPEPGPVYHLGGDAPPPGCTNATQVVDVNGKPTGWISDRDC